MRVVGLILAYFACPLVEGYTLWRVWSILIVPYIAGAPVLGAVPFTGLALMVGLLRYRLKSDPKEEFDQARTMYSLTLRYFACVLVQFMVAMFNIALSIEG